MLVLTRKPGRSIHIGDTIRLKLLYVLPSMALIEIIAPVETQVIEDDAQLRPDGLLGQAARYVSWQFIGDALRIGEATILIGRHEDTLHAQPASGRSLRIGIDAPRHILILRDELRRQPPRVLCAPQFGFPRMFGQPCDPPATRRHAA
jgi:sRNA-binding carbon storage regulator CsrA